jgi:hypothetical protein
MDTLNRLLNNPLGLCLVIFLAVFVIGNLVVMVSMLGRKEVMSDEMASKWGKAIRGGFDAQKRQNAQLDELHQQVARLKSEKSPPKDEP